MRTEEIELLLESQAAIRSNLDLGRTTDLVAAVMSARPEQSGTWVQHCLKQVVKQSGDPEIAQDLLSLFLISQKGWSYVRVSQLFGIEKAELARRLWALRMELVSRQGIWTLSPGQLVRGEMGADCPEVDLLAPWMQAYLDRDLTGNSGKFIQSHLLSCPLCQDRMKLMRQVWVAVERVLPKTGQKQKEATKVYETLRPLRAEVAREQLSTSEWLKLFLMRLEIRLAIGALVFIFFLERTLGR